MSNLNPQRSRAEMLLSFLLGSETLTDWESSFIDSVTGYFDKHGNITEKQLAKLEEINQRDELRK